MRFLSAFLLMFSLVAITGCQGHKVLTIGPKNTIIGSGRTIFPEQGSYAAGIGDSIVGWVDYNTKERFYDYAFPSEDFRINEDSPYEMLTGKKDSKYRILATVDYQNEEYFVIELEADHYGACKNVYLTKSGKLLGVIATRDGRLECSTTMDSISPSSVTFEIKESSETGKYNGLFSDIIFLGVSNGDMKFQYREFVSDKLGRRIPRKDYYQEFTYPVDTDIVIFKNIKFKVVDVSPSRISYETF